MHDDSTCIITDPAFWNLDTPDHREKSIVFLLVLDDPNGVAALLCDIDRLYYSRPVWVCLSS